MLCPLSLCLLTLLDALAVWRQPLRWPGLSPQRLKQTRGKLHRGSVGTRWDAFDVMGVCPIPLEAESRSPATCCTSYIPTPFFPPTCGDGIVIEVLGYKLRSWQFPKARFVHHPSIQIEELMACKSGSIGVVRDTGWTDGSSPQPLVVQLRERPQESLGCWSFLGLALFTS